MLFRSRLDHKIAKLGLIKLVPGVDWLRPDARSGDHGITLEEFTPFGVVGAVTPSTHSIPTLSGNIVNICSTASLRGAANGTAYYASKFALRGMTECWRAELRQHNIRVFLINPSEVLTNFGAAAGFVQKANPTKLRGEDIAHMVKAVLEMDDRGFTPELTIFATNPKD